VVENIELKERLEERQCGLEDAQEGQESNTNSSRLGYIE
jgi:hypothetical protein